MDMRRDLAIVLAMQEDTYRGNFPGFRFSQAFLDEFRQVLRYAARSSDEALYVAERDDSGVVGFLWVCIMWLDYEETQRVALVKNVSVTPPARRQGIGRRLMLEAEAFAQRKGATKLTLQVTTSNVPAVELYRSLGYEVERYYMSKRV